jgi:RES domain-containing protein
MIVYRLAAEQFKDDLSGKGAEIYGGRWNPVGSSMLYTSQSRALANLEIVVNTVLGVLPIGYHILEIEIPVTASILEISSNQLPKEWRKRENYTQLIGDNFLKQQQYLVLKVPSASVAAEYNYLINPAHPSFNEVKLLLFEPYEFDERLFNPTIR